MIRPRAIAPTAVTALALLGAGCGGSDEKRAAPAAGGDKVSIADFKFMPANITVPAGTRLVFSNGDTAAHTATANDRSFDTGSIRKGKKATVTLAKPGSFAYICDFHPFMKGTVTVE